MTANTSPEPTRRERRSGAGGAVELALIRTEAGWAALQEEWTALHRRVARNNPFLSWEWTAAHRTALAPAGEPFVLAARRGGRLVGVAPLRLTRMLGFRVLRFMAEERSDYLGFLVDPEYPELAASFLEHLDRLRDEWDLAILRRVCDATLDPGGAGLPAGLRSFAARDGTAASLSLAGDWEQLCATGPGQLRHTRKWVKRFARDGGIVERLAGPAAASAAEAITAVEAASWKAARGVTMFQDDRERHWLRTLLATLGLHGKVEVWLARVKGRPVAFLLNLVTPERTGCYQCAYDQDFRSYYPGGVLQRQAIECAWGEGRREYDFMLGEEEYKSKWTNRQRPLCERALFPAGLRGRLAFGALVLTRWLLRRYALAHAGLRWWRGSRHRLLGWMRGGRAAPPPRDTKEGNGSGVGPLEEEGRQA